ncbi:F-box/kelch-repeat protein At3g23880 isoform X4 [Ricinus communis]|uniref:F-box/kelch-repeat protein At3g23880 isoform X4 n=1 Tax=Ricinus communis TaxID=3988 RepID=UPI00201A8AA5|nr:F-box/kelch-repeat protein At3g23880 isoform X4 [Ricinus communis]
MSKLPQDLITEILSRVPVKPLIRFKCVCKTWISLISNPEFAKLQLKRAKENNNVSNHYRLLLATWPPQSLDYEAYCNDDISNALRKLSYHAIAKDPNDNYDVRILGSCDGLVYLCNEYHDSMFLWNPTIGDYKELPKPNGAFHEEKFKEILTLPDSFYSDDISAVSLVQVSTRAFSSCCYI